MPTRRPSLLPTKSELLDLLDTLEVRMSDLIRRWGDGVAPEIRAEIIIGMYEPTLRALIRARRRP